jgi:flagellar motility protein MotE (MotC chaperone)
MKRSSRLLLGCLILAKAGLALLLMAGQGGHVFLFQTQAMASEKTQTKDLPPQTETGNTPPESADLKAVLRVKMEIEKEKESIRREREELLAIQGEINKKLGDLSQLRNEIKAQMEVKKSMEEQRMKQLVKVYSAMKPQVAAGLIERLDLSFAVEVLSRMQGDTVGSILSFVDKDKAARICQELARAQ